MMKAIVLEDDPIHQKNLTAALKKAVVETEVLAVCSNVPDGVAAIEKHKPDLLFLDIELRGEETGFDLLRRYPRPDFAVIFITQFNTADNAIRAIRASALDFLPKPFFQEELDTALTRFVRNRATNVLQTQSLSDYISAPDKPLDFLWLTGHDGKIRVELSNILYAASSGSYTKFHLLAPVDRLPVITSSKKLKYYEELLSETDIFRAHNQHLVNMRYVEKFRPEGDGGMATMKGGIELSVSRSHKDEFKRRLKLRG